MHDDERPDPPAQPPTGPDPEGTATWVGEAGVSGEHVFESGRAPRLHWALMVLGPAGLAIAILTSLWSSSRHVVRSVNVQVETRAVIGEQLAIRTQIVGGDLKPLPGSTAVRLSLVDDGGVTHELAALREVGDGLSQGTFIVPALEPGSAELLLHYLPVAGWVEPFEERVPIELVRERDASLGRVVVSENMLQWADDTDAQPESVRIDVIPDGRLLAGFDNRVFVRVTDVAGRPWKPAFGSARIQVRLASGEFGGIVGDPDKPPILYDGPVDALGLVSVSGLLSSDAVRFEVQLVGDKEIAAAKAAAEAAANPLVESPPAENPPPEAAPPEAAPPEAAPPVVEAPAALTGPKRRLRFVSFAGTVRVSASTDFAHPGEEIKITVDAISTKRPAFVDVHGPSGAWIDSFTPPLVVPQQREWIVPDSFAPTDKPGPFIQFEAYQSTLRPEDTSAIARVQLAAAGRSRADSFAPLLERAREQLSLPRVDRHFEIGRERAYLSHIEAAQRDGKLDAATLEHARAYLVGSLAVVVNGPPQALNTRAREDETLAVFKRKWTIAIRWFLLGGGGLFICVMSIMLWRNQRQLESSTTAALGLVAGDSVLDDEELADQSLAIIRARRELLARGVLMIVLAVAGLLLTVAMLESLVWEY